VPLNFEMIERDGKFTLEPMAGMPRAEWIEEGVGKAIQKAIRPPELTIPGGTYIKPPKMSDIEYDPPTRSLLQKLLDNYM